MTKSVATDTDWVVWFKRAGSDRKLHVQYDMQGKPQGFGIEPSVGTKFTLDAAEYMAKRLQSIHPLWTVGFDPWERAA